MSEPHPPSGPTGDSMSEHIPLKRRWLIATQFAFVCTSSYLFINHLPLREPVLLWRSPIDELIPFMVWTIWPYIALLLTDYVFPLFIRERHLFRVTMRAYGIGAGLSFLFWTLWPTTLPRYGIIPTGDSLSELTYRFLITVDPPNNCFPSGHITIPTVLFWAFAAQWPRWRCLIWLSFATLSLTILTTKQHYVLDLVGGIGAGGVGLWLSHRWELRRH
jgi:hypothetical protein